MSVFLLHFVEEFAKGIKKLKFKAGASLTCRVTNRLKLSGSEQ